MPAERRADDFTPLGAGEVQGAAYGYRTPRVIPAFREHLFYGLLLDMKAMYRRGAASDAAGGMALVRHETARQSS